MKTVNIDLNENDQSVHKPLTKVPNTNLRMNSLVLHSQSKGSEVHMHDGD